MVVRLSAIRTGHPLLPRKTPGTHFCHRLSRTPGPQLQLEGLGQLKKIHLIRTQTHDLPACSKCLNQLCYRVPCCVNRNIINIVCSYLHNRMQQKWAKNRVEENFRKTDEHITWNYNRLHGRVTGRMVVVLMTNIVKYRSLHAGVPKSDTEWWWGSALTRQFDSATQLDLKHEQHCLVECFCDEYRPVGCDAM
jgi:hypothetical protein